MLASNFLTVPGRVVEINTTNVLLEICKFISFSEEDIKKLIQDKRFSTIAKRAEKDFGGYYEASQKMLSDAVDSSAQ